MENLRAVVFDWAGTMVDFGSRAPMSAFVEAFSQFQVPVSIEEAREPMGLPKRDHIKAMMTQPRIAQRWQEVRGAVASDDDIDEVYQVFVPLNEKVAAAHAILIPGTVELVRTLHDADIKVGSTTGYTRSIMERVLPVADRQGYTPDNLVCADDVPVGRPTAMMMYKCFVDLGVHEPRRVVKVDDTTPGIEEGIAAGTWTIGISLSGNEVGLSLEELGHISKSVVSERNSKAAEKLTGAGAHYIVDTVADLEPVLVEISERIDAGHQP